MNRNMSVLFDTASQSRESAAIYQIFNSPHQFAICSDWWDWFAINIPLSHFDKNGFEGDLDLIVRRPGFNALGMPDKKARPTYRVFEVKSSTIDKSGTPKSIKNSERTVKKICGQLEKIQEFGSPNIFLLEIFILQDLYSSLNAYPHKSIMSSIESKIEQLAELGVGYLFTSFEPTPGMSEAVGGKYYNLEHCLLPKSNKISGEFYRLADRLDDFFTKNGGLEKGSIINFCNSCRELSISEMNGPYVCGNCRDKLN